MYHNFLSNICCLTVPKSSVDDFFCVPESFWYRKVFLDQKGKGGRNFVVSFY